MGCRLRPEVGATDVLKLMCEQGWLRRAKGSRVVQVTPTGEVEITSRLGVDFLDLPALVPERVKI